MAPATGGSLVTRTGRGETPLTNMDASEQKRRTYSYTRRQYHKYLGTLELMDHAHVFEPQLDMLSGKNETLL